MRSQKMFAVSAVVCLTLLTCSFALAAEKSKEISGPIAGPEVHPVVSAPMRELGPQHVLGEEFAPATITGLLNIAGQSAPKGILYSDAVGAVGATQYVQLINNQYTVYDKTSGAVVTGPVAENLLWANAGDSCATSVGGDGVVTYDQLANVWVFLHHGISTTTGNLDCMAVSTTSDATGTYYLYDYSLTGEFPDKPKLGVWPDAYYISQDLLDPTTKSFVRSMACAVNRAAMLVGGGGNSVCFQGSISLPTFVVTPLDGQTQPNAGEVAFFWQLDQRPNNGKNNLNSFQFHVDWTNTNNSTFTGPVANALPAYSDACISLKPCIPEPGTTNVLSAWGDRLMSRITYRNFGTYESVLITHSVTLGTGTAAHSGIRWYEYRTPLTPVIYQYGTYSPDKTNFRWMGSMAQDKYGDMAVGYSISSSTVYPGLRYAVRVPTDHTGILEAEQTIVTGGGSQNGTNKNWSSYSSMTVDPVDDCTFYYTGQYYKTSSLEGWSTQIASFRLPSCTN